MSAQGKSGSLGQGQRVFIHYVPTLSCASDNHHNMGTLEMRIYKFSKHLVTYGFDVRVDLFCDKSSRFDRAAWNDHELSQVDWVIFVCSRSSYELFVSSNYYKPCFKDQEIRPITALHEIALYNQITDNVNSKVIPVILLQEDNNAAYIPPALKDPTNIHRIFEDGSENLSGDFERLVHRMAGTNKIEISAPGPRETLAELPSEMPASKYFISLLTLQLTYMDCKCLP